MAAKTVLLSDIVVTGATQLRTSMDGDYVKSLVEALNAGDRFPPVRLFKGADGTHLIGDGHHRIGAYRAVGLTEINAEVTPGELDDALLYAASANETHGLRRTQRDKRKAIKAILEHATFSKKSDRTIAEMCKVSHPLVAEVRNQFLGNPSKPAEATEREGKDGKTRTVAPNPKKAPKVGTEIYDWSNFENAFGGLVRQIEQVRDRYKDAGPEYKAARNLLDELLKGSKAWKKRLISRS